MLLDRLGIDHPEIDRLADVPSSALVTAPQAVFDAVPVQTPGTPAFAPIVDGDVIPDCPIKLAREGRSHPVPFDHRLLPDMPEGVAGIRVSGRLRGDDLREFKPAMEKLIKTGEVRIVEVVAPD